MPPPLLTLFLTAFSFGTAEFVIAGLLPEVSEGLGVSIPVTGYLISGYAIGIAVGGPLLALVTKRIDRRTLILLLCAVFVLGQAFCALAPSFELLMLARVLVSIVHGTFFGVAFIVATALVPPGRQGAAIALILAGLTVANVLGVPGGTAIGNAFGWRATFWAVGALGLLATLGTAMLLPRGVGAGSTGGSMLREFKALGRQQIAFALAIVVLVMIGQYALFTYIAPLLLEVTRLDANGVPWLLLLYGLGATIGVLIGGRLADWRLMPSLLIILFLQVLAFSAVSLSAPHLWLMLAIVPIWGGINFAFGSPVQTRVLSWAADAPNLASTLIPSAFNIGIAIGAVTGAALLERGAGYDALPWIGAVTSGLALVFGTVSLLLDRRSGATPPRPAGSFAAS